MIGQIPRWKDHSGRLFTTKSAEEYNKATFDGWFDQSDVFDYGTAPRSPKGNQLGSFGKLHYLLKPPRGVVFINAASLPFMVVGAEPIVDHTSLNYPAIAEIGAFLAGTDISYAYGEAGVEQPEISFGNPYYPDNWPGGGLYAGLPGNPVTQPGDYVFPHWLRALTLGMPGDPDKNIGTDLFVILNAWTDNGFALTDYLGIDESYLTYVDGWCYYSYSGPYAPYTAEQPTTLFGAHYRRFASIIPKCARFRAIVIRPTDMPYYMEANAAFNIKTEAMSSAHFNSAINGTGGYASLGPSLKSFGVELIEYTGGIQASVLIDIIKEHYGL